MFFCLEFSGFFCNTEPFPITRQVFATLNLPVPVTSAPAIAIQPRLPIAAVAPSPPVRFLNVQSEPSPSASVIPGNLQKLLNALSLLSGTTSFTPFVEPTPPPPVAHQTYNANYICSGRRNGIHRDRTNCTIFYFCCF